MAPAPSVGRQDMALWRHRLIVRVCDHTTGETTTIWSWSLVFVSPTKYKQYKEIEYGIHLVVGWL